MRYAYMYIYFHSSSYRFANKYQVISDRKKKFDPWKLEQRISWYTLSFSIAVNMVTSLSVCSGRKILNW